MAQPEQSQKLCFSPPLCQAPVSPNSSQCMAVLSFRKRISGSCLEPGSGLQEDGCSADPGHMSLSAWFSEATRQSWVFIVLQKHSCGCWRGFNLQNWCFPLKSIILSREMLARPGWSLRTSGGKDGGKKINFGLNLPLSCHRELLDEPNSSSCLPLFAFLSSLQATL